MSKKQHSFMLILALVAGLVSGAVFVFFTPTVSMADCSKASSMVEVFKASGLIKGIAPDYKDYYVNAKSWLSLSSTEKEFVVTTFSTYRSCKSLSGYTGVNVRSSTSGLKLATFRERDGVTIEQ
jgi:hypothetical protein